MSSLLDYWTAGSSQRAPAPEPEQSSFWDQVVGIPLDVWLACDTSEAVSDAIAARERGDYLPPPPPCDCDECFEWVEVYDLLGASIIRTRVRATGTHH